MSAGKRVQRVAKAGEGRFALRYVPGAAVPLKDGFGIVCRLAFQAARLVFLAEELSDVTTPSWAPPAWRQITTQGRHRGLHVLGAAQRPSLIDKTFLGNCTLIRCGALGYEADRRAMALELDTQPARVQALRSLTHPGGVALSMLERNRQTGDLCAVTLTVTSAGRVRETRKPL